MKIIVPFRSIPTRRVIENFKKIEKKISKNSKILLWIRLKPKLVGERCERPKIKIIVPFCSHPLRNRKIQKNCKKIKKKYHYGSILNQNRLEKAEKERK